jgi:hypothetical protein
LEILVAFEDEWEVSFLGSYTEVVENHVFFFVFEFGAFSLCFLGFLDVGQDFGVPFSSGITLL